MKKKLLSGILAFALLFGSAAALPEGLFETSSTITASAEGETSGKCGENVNWSLKDGVLTISGTGNMTDYDYDGSPFYNSTNIKSVVIKSGVTNIGSYAFSGCDSLTSVTIPNSVTSIGKAAFYDCKKLTSVAIPGSVASIGEKAFTNCSSLSSITLEDGLKSIGEKAFLDCEKVYTITIPQSVKSIGQYALGYVELGSDEDIDYVVIYFKIYCYKDSAGEKYAKDNKFDYEIVKEEFEYKVLKDGTAEITKYNGKGGAVTIPSTIGGKKVTSIGQAAFFECSSLTSITIPNSVTFIGAEAFYKCTSLESVTIPSSVTSIRPYAFYGTKWLENQQKKSPFVVVNGILIDGTTCKGKVTIPSSVKSIGEWAFHSCEGLTSVTIPNSVTSIGECAFEDCTSLTSVTIPNSVTTIEGSAFNGCTSLKSVTIPKSVTSIYEHAFGYDANERIDGFTIKCYKGTAAEQYAVDNWFDFELLGLKHVEAKDATCTKDGNIEYWTYDGKFYSDEKATTEITKEETIINAFGHSWGEPTWKWKGTDSATAKFVCEIDNSHVKTMTAKITSKTTKATCDKDGKTVYTATVNFEGKTYTDTKTVTIDKLGHKYGEPTWTWSRDNKTCTAKFVCANDKSHVKTVTAEITSKTTTATCEKDGKTVYTATVSFNGKTYTTTKTVTITKTGHKFSAWKTTGFDLKNNTSTQTRKCSVCGKTEKQTTKNAVNRLAGDNRYSTAATLSSKMYKTSDTVILATGLTYQDALVAVPLASAYDAPLLLGTEKHITAQTEAEIKRLKAKNVIVVSTNGAIGDKAKAELKALKLNVTYIEGKTNYETAAKVAKALQTKKAPDTIFFATDSSFADALTASPVAAIKNAPIIYLKNKGSIDSATASYLKSVKGKVKNAYIIGGDGVISNAMMKNVATALGRKVGSTVQRVAGKNRYETCVAVNNKFKSVLSSDGICVAKGLDFPDALAGGVYAAKNRQALFLADGKKLQDVQNTYLKSKNACKITVFGGTGAVPDDLVKLIAKASV